MSAPSPRIDERLRERLGVTRIARVTGLDRTGLEVACAVRPFGHVLQVSNGKGLTVADAFTSALSEAAELWASERVPHEDDVEWGTARSLQRRFPDDEVWGADALGSAGELISEELWSDEHRCAFIAGEALHRAARVWVPAVAVHCPPPGSVTLGPAMVRWTSNGLAAHPDRQRAVQHALLEVIERDQLARALPQGFTVREVERRMVAPGSLRRGGAASGILARLRDRGFDAFLFDVRARSPKTGRVEVPVAGALLFDRDGGPVPLTAGYAAALDWESAFRGALLEAAQSRLTDIHGAREDVAAMDPLEARELHAWCKRAESRGRGAHPSTPPLRTLRALVERLRASGRDRAAVFSIAPADLGAAVVKVIVPGLLVSELL